MNKAFSLSIMIIFLATIFLISGCSNNGDVTGSAVQNSGQCFDTDGGKDFYKQGIVSPKEEVPVYFSDRAQKIAESASSRLGKQDLCAKSSGIEGAKEGDLLEYFCDDGAFTSMPYTCPNGCRDGACVLVLDETPVILKEVIQITEDKGPCIDSDNGRNYLEKGNIYGTHIDPSTAEDECVFINGKFLLQERICFTEDIGAVLQYDCAAEKKMCSDGRCIAGEPVTGSSDKPRIYEVISDQVITEEPGCRFGGTGNFKPTAAGYIAINENLTPKEAGFKGYIGSIMNDGCDLKDKNTRIEYYCDSNGYPHEDGLLDTPGILQWEDLPRRLEAR